jgi:hypothetical protein
MDTYSVEEQIKTLDKIIDHLKFFENLIVENKTKEQEQN